MAGKKGKIQHAVMACSTCQMRGYKTMRNVVNSQKKLEFSKYCSSCQKHTLHKETK